MGFGLKIADQLQNTFVILRLFLNVATQLIGDLLAGQVNLGAGF